VNFRTKQYLRKRFRDYYHSSRLTLPPEFARREWGFIFFDELPEVVMRRHRAFSGEIEALDYIRGMVPAHVYHSAAYYRFPGASTMKEKQWQGADLIFDLDADHLPPEVRGKSYKDMLDAVQVETVKLLDFLLEDFGFSEDNISIVFSGGRGYHIHVRDPKVLSLESAERREIVDYISGTGFDYDSVLTKRKTKWKVYDGIRRHPMAHETRYEMAEMSTWGKRVAKETINFLEKIRLLGYEEVSKELMRIEGITTTKAKNIIKKLKSIESFDELNKIILDSCFETKSLRSVRQNIVKNAGVHVEGNTDNPVTSDIRRLIRMPSSLHGGSGMCVVPLPLSEFQEFEPLNDAVVFSEEEIKIEINSPLKPQNSMVEMKGKSFTITEGINTLPEYAAIYLMCRGAAEYA
jgi:DNA primase small subunit